MDQGLVYSVSILSRLFYGDDSFFYLIGCHHSCLDDFVGSYKGSVSMMVAYEVIYQGHVQGVCFRARTVQCADQFIVQGYVNNRSDGTVYLFVQGQEAEVDGFLARVLTMMHEHIIGHSQQVAKVDLSIGDFTIRPTT